MSGGRVKVPVVFKAGYGFTAGWAGQHTGSIYGMFLGIPGLKVVLPSTPADAKGLMATAIRDDNPVCYLMHYLLALEHGDVPEGEYLVPFGEAAIRREGGDVTIVATGWTVGKALAAAETLAGEGIQRRGDRPAHARAARHRDDPVVGREDRAPGDRRPGARGTRRRAGDRRRGRRARVLVAEGADRARDRARRDRPLQRADGGVRAARRGEDRRARCARCSGSAPVAA